MLSLSVSLAPSLVEARRKAGPQPPTATSANLRGMQFYRAKDYAQAADYFRLAITLDPMMVIGHYNLACTEALRGNRAAAIEQLRWLQGEGGPLATSKLRRARTDPDWSALRDDPEVQSLLDGANFTPFAERPLVALRKLRSVIEPTSAIGARVFASVTASSEAREPPFRASFAWCSAQPNDGIAIAFAQPTHLTAITVAAGDWRSKLVFADRDAVDEVTVRVDGALTKVGRPAPMQDPDGPLVRIDLPDVTVTTLSITLSKTRTGHTPGGCISSVELVDGTRKLTPVVFDADAIAALPTALQKTQEALAGLGAPELERALQFPFSYQATTESKAVSFATPAALGMACTRGTHATCPARFEPLEPVLRVLDEQTVTLGASSGAGLVWVLRWANDAWRLLRVEPSGISAPID